MSRLVPTSWFMCGERRSSSREIASIFARHGLGWLLVEIRLGDLIPFERGWFGHPKREALYTQAEHLRIALGLVMTVYHPPGWEQYGSWVFLIAFLLSLAFGAWLMCGIWPPAWRSL